MCNIPFILTLTLFQIQDKVTKNFVYIIVDVQDTFHFDIDLISDPGQGHTKLVFFLHALSES